jgi:hypothetical protein
MGHIYIALMSLLYVYGHRQRTALVSPCTPGNVRAAASTSLTRLSGARSFVSVYLDRADRDFRT